jgi:ABC-type Fe3+-hydroxamate transport system substrate-binding protein
MFQRRRRKVSPRFFRRAADRLTWTAARACIVLISVASPGCDRDNRAGPAPTTSTRDSSHVTVASLVPAATDLLLGMGAGDQLVAVSNWDAERPEIAGLPRVGDYRTVDWEKLASIRPDVMIIQLAPDKMPPGLSERAAELGIKLVNLKIVYLQDVFTSLDQLGEAIGQPDKALNSSTALRSELADVLASVVGKPPVRTLISRSESPLAVVGGGNFMNDLLGIAGGRNVIDSGENSFPNIDVERLVALDPDVVLHLLPGSSQQVVEQAKTFWASHPQLSAVKNGRVHYLTETYLLVPGQNMGKVARRFAELLHPGVPATTAAAKDERP